MAARNLRAAAEAATRHNDIATGLGVSTEESATWRDAAADVYIPYDEKLGVHPQSEGYTHHELWDFERYKDRYPLLLSAPYFDLYRKQVIKQADLVLAMHWCGDRFTPEDKARNFDYYERRTVRDSSLSACTQAVMAAEVGHLELAHDYAYEAALIDLRDLHHNSRDGLHMASLAGAWSALVAGFGGMRDYGGELLFDPALPTGISRLAFSLRWREVRLRVDVNHRDVTYSLHEGDHGTVTFHHDGEVVTVTDEQPVTVPLKPRKALLPAPPQPAGRQPVQRHAQG
jgi:trehalose/maltose hydrolase-like predicted phosphorylase